MMKRSVVFALSVFLIGILALPAIVLCAPGASVLDFEEGHLSLKGRQVHLASLLKDIARAAGVEIVLFETLSTSRVDIDVEETPVDEVLRRILKGHNFVVVFQAEPSRCTVRYFEGHQILDLEDSIERGYTIQRRGTENPKKLQAASVYGERRPTRAKIDQVVISKKQGPSPEKEGKHENSLISSFGSLNKGHYKGSSSVFEGRSNAAHQSWIPTDAAPVVKDQDVSNKSVPKPNSKGKSHIEYLRWRIATGISDKEYERWVAVRGKKYVIHDKERLAYYESMLEDD
jgi:hypothetical protein